MADASHSPAVGAKAKPTTSKGSPPAKRGSVDLELPRGTDSSGEHCWCQLDASKFEVRGANYLADRVKSPSTQAIFQMAHAEMYSTEKPQSKIAERPDGWLKAARAKGDTRFYLIVAYQCPSGSRTVMVNLYFAVEEGAPAKYPEFAKVWQAFLAEGDEYRNARWKVIPAISEGAWLVQKAVGTKPALLATKLTHTWHQTEHYIEADCDVASSSMASTLVNMLQSYAKSLVIDLGFAIEPRDVSELPEHVLGSVQLCHIDLSAAPNL